MPNSPTPSPSASPLAVRAILACLEKRALMDEANRERLRLRMANAGVSDLAGLRRFLVDGGVKPMVAKILLNQLPAQDDLRIGGCHLLAHLAEGGMGSVWLADRNDGLVVLKTLKPELVTDAGYLKRFEREAAITARLNHPHIVRCLGHGLDHGRAYLLLEFVPGGDVETLIKRGGILSEAEALTILYQTACGLTHAWRQSLVHRDIKPANLFIDGEGRVKVADFGLARSTMPDATVLTMQGMTVGSPAYMAPEQIRAAPLDCRTNIYSCGCVLYYCLAARTPFIGSLSELMVQQLSEKVPPILSFNPALSEATVGILQRCLEKTPDDRFANPDDFAKSLSLALEALGGDPHAALSRETIASSTARIVASTRCSGEHVLPGQGPISGLPPAPSEPKAPHDQKEPGDQSGHYQPATEMPVSLSGALQPRNPRGGAAAMRPEDEDLMAASTLVALPGQVPASGINLDADQATMVGDLGLERFTGDWQSAIPGPRLTLSAGFESVLVLLAQEAAVLGKLRTSPVDLTLRDYPAEANAESCQRVSKQHVRIALAAGRVTVNDLGSANGTLVDGRMLEKKESRFLEDGREHAVEIPDSVALSVRAIPRRTRALTTLVGAPTAVTPPGHGLASSAVYDAIVIRRTRNRTALAYALVLRRLLIGPEIADLPVAGWEGEALEVTQWNGRWVWRRGHHPWSPAKTGAHDGVNAKKGEIDDLR